MVTHNPNPFKQWTAFFVMLIALALLFGLMACSHTKKALKDRQKAKERIAAYMIRYPDMFVRDTIHFRDTVYAPADSASTTFPCDSLKPGDTLKTVSPNGAGLTITKGQDGRINAKSDCPEKPVYIDRWLPCPEKPNPAIVAEQMQKECDEEKEFKWWPILLLAGIVLLLAFILRR